jgi:hypothetical protein
MTSTFSLRLACTSPLSLLLCFGLGCGGELPVPGESEEPMEPVEPVEPLGRVCPLPKENPVVVDIEGDGVYMFAVFSDGRTWFWGYGYHPQPKKYPQSKDEICLRSLDMDGEQ